MLSEAIMRAPVQPSETQGISIAAEPRLEPLNPSGLSQTDIRWIAQQMKVMIDQGRAHPRYGRFVAEKSVEQLEWIVQNGWALVSFGSDGALEGCAYFLLLGFVTDGRGQRYPVFKFGGAVLRDQRTFRRYMLAALTSKFDQAIILARTHRGFGRMLERLRFVRYYRRELKRKYRQMYRMYFGKRLPQDDRDFFVRFPDDYVHPRAWLLPDRPLVYNQWQYREKAATKERCL